MDLKITTIIPTDDSALANRLMKSLIDDQAVVLGIVVGTDDWSNNAIQKVDKVAYSRREIRRSVWIRNIEPVRPLIQSLFSNSPGFAMPGTPPFMITVSMADKVFDLILSSEPVFDYVRIDKAFLLAEKG